MCFLYFYLLLSETFRVLTGIERDIVMSVHWSDVSAVLVRF